jgi:protein TonB
MSERSTALWRKIGWTGLGLGLAGAFVMLLVSMTGHVAVPQKHLPPVVMMVRLPPPPPPPPTPPPPKTAEPPKLQEPKQMAKIPDKQPPKAAAPLGLTAPAGAGGDQYGLGVGNGDGMTVGGAGNGGGNGYGFYAGIVSSQIRGALQRDDRLRRGRYHLALRLWLSSSGEVTRAVVATTSGDPQTDNTITHLLIGLSLGEAPPAGMPQPVNIRIGAEPG